MTKRQKILETTLDLIAKHGVQATSMSFIVKESGVATGTIYHHFKSKEDIINELYLEKKSFFTLIGEDILNSEQSVEKQFKNLWKALYGYYMVHPNVFSFYLQMNNSIYITDETKEKALLTYEPIVAFFAKGIEDGIFVKTDVMLLVELLHGNITTFVGLVMNQKVGEDLLNDAIELSWKQAIK